MGATAVDVRAANAQRILDVLRTNPHDWLSVRVLAELSGISRPTVTRVCDDFVAGGWLSVKEGISQGVGRPAREFRFRAEHQLAASVEARPDSLHAVVADLTGTVLAEERLTGQDLRDPRAAAQAITDMLRALCEKAPGPHLPAAIAIAVPALVEPGGDIWASRVVPEWVDAGLLSELKQRLPGASIMLANDSRLAARAELSHGFLRGADAALYIHTGSFFSTTPIIRGEVYRGGNGGACAGGDVGVMPRLPEGVTLPALLAKHDLGDEEATRELKAFVNGAAFGLSLLASAYDPTTIVVGGPLAAHPDLVIPPLRNELRRNTLKAPTVLVSGQNPWHIILRGGIDAALSLLDLEHVSAS